jgi:hypothetical protein
VSCVADVELRRMSSTADDCPVAFGHSDSPKDPISRGRCFLAAEPSPAGYGQRRVGSQNAVDVVVTGEVTA